MNDQTPAKTRRKPARRRTRRPDGEARLQVAELQAAETAAWERACNEVTASILSDQVHQTRGRYLVDPRLVDHAMHERIPEAKKELGVHRVGDVGCMCRHHAIITVGANQQARMAGGPPSVYFDGARAVLEAYLARRS